MLKLIQALAPTGQGRSVERAQQLVARRARTVELYEAGMPVRAIAAQLGTTQPAIVTDLRRLRKAGLVGNRREERVAA